jgi:hypothetical protein
MGTKNAAVVTANPADILSRNLKVSRDTLLAAFNSARAELTGHLNALNAFSQQNGIETGDRVDEPKRVGRPKGSKSRKGARKSGRDPGRPKGSGVKGRKAARKSGRGPGRPKGSGTKAPRKSGRGTSAPRSSTGKRGRPSVIGNAIREILNASNSPMRSEDVVSALKAKGIKTSSSIKQQVSGFLAKMVSNKEAKREGRGAYVFTGTFTPAPAVTSAVTETTATSAA